jgi:hypothetical protein
MRLAGWQAHQLVFVDESAANERTADRKYDWAPLGQIARVVQPLARSMRWSILPAYTTEGYITWEIRQAAFTKETFNAFIIEKVLPLCSPYPGPRLVLVMDNARIHHSEVGGCNG